MSHASTDQSPRSSAGVEAPRPGSRTIDRAASLLAVDLVDRDHRAPALDDVAADGRAARGACRRVDGSAVLVSLVDSARVDDSTNATRRQTAEAQPRRTRAGASSTAIRPDACPVDENGSTHAAPAFAGPSLDLAPGGWARAHRLADLPVPPAPSWWPLVMFDERHRIRLADALNYFVEARRPGGAWVVLAYARCGADALASARRRGVAVPDDVARELADGVERLPGALRAGHERLWATLASATPEAPAMTSHRRRRREGGTREARVPPSSSRSTRCAS